MMFWGNDWGGDTKGAPTDTEGVLTLPDVDGWIEAWGTSRTSYAHKAVIEIAAPTDQTQIPIDRAPIRGASPEFVLRTPDWGRVEVHVAGLPSPAERLRVRIETRVGPRVGFHYRSDLPLEPDGSIGFDSIVIGAEIRFSWRTVDPPGDWIPLEDGAVFLGPVRRGDSVRVDLARNR